MKHENGFWVDENGNRWRDNITEQEAKSSSDSLKNCTDCTECVYCKCCRGCMNCLCCYDCTNSNKCYGCTSCDNCTRCDYCCDCNYCSNCRSCASCDYCKDCTNCEYCHNCRKYDQNPSSYVTKKVGSRDEQTIFYYGDTEKGKSFQVVCGCFWGNLEEFEAAVLKTHRYSGVYREQYLKEIRKVKVLFELE